MAVITGFHAIEETLRVLAETKHKKKGSEKSAVLNYTLFFAKKGPRVKKILSLAQDISLTIKNVSETELNDFVKNLSEQERDHRGVVLILHENQSNAQNNNINTILHSQIVTPSQSLLTKNTMSLNDYIFSCNNQNIKNQLVVILDSITDPHNVGAIMRSAHQLGVNLLIMGKHNSVSESAVIKRSSAGASEWIPTCIVPNLVEATKQLQQNNFWVYGAMAEGNPCYSVALENNIALVMGSEGQGISKLLKKACDDFVSIPSLGKLDSLNVSVATGILLYEVQRQRLVAQNNEKTAKR